MNFVIFSRNFYPQHDPEAFCATRFASALAEAGHSVHVVTAEYDCEYDYKALVDPRMEITRVRAPLKHHRFPCVSVRQAMVMENDMWNVPAFCRAVKKVLRKYENPILITRALPLASAIVGVKTRKYAYRWVSHFSDPIPWFPVNRKILRLKDYLYRRWIKKAIRLADAVSVTCPLAIRYYHEEYSDVARGKKFIVALHIGDNKLDDPSSEGHESVFSRPIVLHPGDMYNGRGDAIFNAVDRLNAQGVSCLFVLDRPPLTPDMKHWFQECKNALALGIRGSALNADLNKSADVVFVPDFVREFDYSPYLMSKFIYQIYGDRPIVVYAKQESCMADYCRRYPQAGLFFSEAGNAASLVAALKSALACSSAKIERRAIRQEFSASTISQRFVQDVQGIL